MNDQERSKKDLAVALWEHGCVQKGDFTLSSGKKSDLYVDCRKLLTTQEGLHLACQAMCQAIRLAWPDVAVLGTTGVGGALLLQGVLLESYYAGVSCTYRVPPFRSFVVRDEAKAYGSDEGRFAGHAPKNADVILVDDVLTTGSSLLRALDALKARGCHVIAAYVLLDRDEGGKATLALEGMPCYALLTRQELLDAGPPG